MGAQGTGALIFGSAPCRDWGFLAPYLAGRDYKVFCADGGLLNAKAAGLSPDAVVGDWDSGGAPQAGVPCTTLPAEKDMTDLQAAVDLALREGFADLLLCGCTGGPRLDHTASNLVLTEYVAARGGRAILVDGENETRLLTPGTLVRPNVPPYRYFSIIPLDRDVTGVTLVGAKYPLDQAHLTRGNTFSVSNEPSVHEVSITLETGRALLICSERI